MITQPKGEGNMATVAGRRGSAGGNRGGVGQSGSRRAGRSHPGGRSGGGGGSSGNAGGGLGGSGGGGASGSGGGSSNGSYGGNRSRRQVVATNFSSHATSNVNHGSTYLRATYSLSVDSADDDDDVVDSMWDVDSEDDFGPAVYSYRVVHQASASHSTTSTRSHLHAAAAASSSSSSYTTSRHRRSGDVSLQTVPSQAPPISEYASISSFLRSLPLSQQITSALNRSIRLASPPAARREGSTGNPGAGSGRGGGVQRNSPPPLPPARTTTPPPTRPSLSRPSSFSSPSNGASSSSMVSTSSSGAGASSSGGYHRHSNKPPPRCLYYAAGCCRFGGECNFSHDFVPQRSSDNLASSSSGGLTPSQGGRSASLSPFQNASSSPALVARQGEATYAGTPRIAPSSSSASLFSSEEFALVAVGTSMSSPATSCTSTSGGSATSNIKSCIFFVQGLCRYGSSCRFAHIRPTPAIVGAGAVAPPESIPATIDRQLSTQIILRPACVEQVPVEPPSCAAQQEEPEDDNMCGVCLENVLQSKKRFGLLQACDHCFCLTCLRTWRQRDGQESNVVRSCPTCRKLSYFVVPSAKFCRGAEKERVIDEYKSNLARTPCRYFSQTGSCRFGPHCFYAHLEEDGRDAKPRQAAEWEERATRRANRNRGQSRRVTSHFGRTPLRTTLVDPFLAGYYSDDNSDLWETDDDDDDHADPFDFHIY